MSFNSRHKSACFDTGSVALSNSITAGTTLTANTFTGGLAEPGSVTAKVAVTISTGSLTLAPKWQASEDGTNFYDIVTLPNTAQTAISATKTVFMQSPPGSWRYLRIAILTAGATAGSSDNYRVSYNYDAPRFMSG